MGSGAGYACGAKGKDAGALMPWVMGVGYGTASGNNGWGDGGAAGQGTGDGGGVG